MLLFSGYDPASYSNISSVWVRYYNKIILYPFYRRGMWMMAGIYAAMLIFFMNAYGGFKIGYLRKGNLIYSQALSLIFTNIFTYFQLSVLDKNYSNQRWF